MEQLDHYIDLVNKGKNYLDRYDLERAATVAMGGLVKEKLVGHDPRFSRIGFEPENGKLYHTSFRLKPRLSVERNAERLMEYINNTFEEEGHFHAYYALDTYLDHVTGWDPDKGKLRTDGWTSPTDVCFLAHYAVSDFEADLDDSGFYAKFQAGADSFDYTEMPGTLGDRGLELKAYQNGNYTLRGLNEIEAHRLGWALTIHRKYRHLV